MSHDINRTCYIFIVDTAEYAGNFERPMVAYMTGCVGECGVGREAAALAHEEWQQAHPPMTEEELEAMWESEYADTDWDTALEGNLFGLPEPLRFGNCARPATIWLSADRKPKIPYSSVAVAFENELTPDQIKTLTERARTFCNNYPKMSRLGGKQPLTFKGVRIVHRVIVPYIDTQVYEEKAP